MSVLQRSAIEGEGMSVTLFIFRVFAVTLHYMIGWYNGNIIKLD